MPNETTFHDEARPLRRLRLRQLLLPAAALAAVIVLLSVWDYSRILGITRELALPQSLGLLDQVESAAGTATLAEESVRWALDDHLFAAAYLVRRLESEGALSRARMPRIAAEAGVARLEILDRDGGILLSNTAPESSPA
ncbi:MAG TPA: hypothetical protein ENI92_09965, partial [Bacteroidetes bacterium]|nr:hypothetical protein [Bacteroidota bacterium]